MHDSSLTTRHSGRSYFQLTLIEEFALVAGGRRLPVPHIVEKVVTYLALANRPVARERLAGALWPECPGPSAAKSLRTALWRLRRIDDQVVDFESERLRLGSAIRVDLVELTEIANRLIHARCSAALEGVPRLLEYRELLPDWDEEWVVADRERYRLARMSALECAAAELLNRHEPAAALMAISAVVEVDPLRESARRLLMQIHLRQKNAAQAIGEYRKYQQLLRAEFGVEPSRRMDELLSAANRTL